jgi:hypothetical protein
MPSGHGSDVSASGVQFQVRERRSVNALRLDVPPGNPLIAMQLGGKVSRVWHDALQHVASA